MMFLYRSSLQAKYVTDTVFYDPLNSCFTDFTNDLLKVIECSNFHALRCESPANNSLNKSIQHIIYGSGFISFDI